MWTIIVKNRDKRIISRRIGRYEENQFEKNRNIFYGTNTTC